MSRVWLPPVCVLPGLGLYGCPYDLLPGQVTYQQQQETLKQQKQAQAAHARQARELETIRQDTW